MAVLLDTSAIIAFASINAPNHNDVRAALAAIKEPLVIPLPVLPEVDYLLTKRTGSAGALTVIQSLITGNILVDHLTHADLERATELMRVYADSSIGFVDSSIIALAERLNSTRIVTLDRRHFTFVRPRHCMHFDLLP